MTVESIVYEPLQTGLGLIRLQRPKQLNALRIEDAQALHRMLDSVLADTQLRVLILTGEGKGFCAGLDLKALLNTEQKYTPTVSQAMSLQLCFAGLISRLRESGVIVIAAVNGVAVGAGMALALAADIRLATEQASFHIGAVKLGLTSGECGISYHLPRLIGVGPALDLMLTGRPVSADQAFSLGMVSEVCKPDALLDAAIMRAQCILELSSYATAHTKRLFWSNLEASSLTAAMELENHAQVLGLMTADFQEAVQAFVEKRPPNFTRK
ncbi:enoyl-CoA hydratase/isomerase family protein [Alcaligenaceae bacterium]|nr:enoyl-CoA hydratase/isomerase family protein [Alcaligenaceae bacterium]